jgi:deoxyribose-phosphate aldolase
MRRMSRRTIDAVMLEQRAASFTTRSIKASSKLAGLRLAMSMIDLTTLEGKDSPEKVRAICRKAIRPQEGFLDPHATGNGDVPGIPSVAAVCVYPSFVKIARDALQGSTVKVASVATGFPSGQYPLDVRVADVTAAVEAGADEIDMVINRGAFLAGKYDLVRDEIRAIKAACGLAHLKIILETGELETYDNVRRASDLAIEAACSVPNEPDVRDGEVFIKTSTGKVQPAATMPVTLIMLDAIRDHYRATGVRIGMKAAGGIRTAKQALHYLVMVKETLEDAWLSPKLFRFGASSLANDILRQIMKETTGHYMAWHDFSEA